ncbi:MAG: histidine phosphatase family protein [Candidatus Kaiserbacteria bacterium]|nr:histidine phosphatase family protein [Candidatus Kaiserbacteria bacterium]
MQNLDDAINLIQHSQKTLFILCGLPYAGKSFIAKELQTHTDIACVSIDKIFQERGFNWNANLLPNAEEWQDIFNQSYIETGETLSEGKNVLYDSTNHTSASRDELRKVSTSVDGTSYVIYIQASIETVLKRWEENQKNPTRPVVSKELVQTTIDMFEEPTESENVIVINNFSHNIIMNNNGNTIYILRHGETIKDPSIPAIEWKLTPETSGILDAMAVEERFKNITAIYTSSEHKAQKTAEPFGLHLGLDVITKDGLEEVKRGSTFLTDEEFQRLKRENLELRDSNLDGGETANQALKRFITAVSVINSEHQNAEILIVSHGTVLALFFSYLKNDFENIFEYWQNIEFCALGIVKDGVVFEDISST